ncbi:MAG: 23S rRNA (pseudouridine(1915)-N(3))-methyltransferase RlmH [Pseudomonadota bacterium]|nr:23S rRNA (pseudouridine(1915)-N(3))-methyltransferase RlmH [Pseudomonadota bacterium]
MRARIFSVADYQKRLLRELPLDLIEIKPGRRGKDRDAKRAIATEGETMLAAIPRDACVIALDGDGSAWRSEELARRLEQWRRAGRDLAFLIGGPDGHAANALARADQRWSLGPLTLPHMLVRLIVAEQLYRATTIIAGHPYHRG